MGKEADIGRPLAVKSLRSCHGRPVSCFRFCFCQVYSGNVFITTGFETQFSTSDARISCERDGTFRSFFVASSLPRCYFSLGRLHWPRPSSLDPCLEEPRLA